MNIKLVIFDLDGTLVDTMDSYADSAASLMQDKYGVDFGSARSLYLETSGFPFCQQLEQIFPDHHLNYNVANQFEEWKKGLLMTDHRLRHGASKAIFHLIENGFKVCLSSNNIQENIDKIVNRWEVEIDSALGFRFGGFQKGGSHFSWFENKFNLKRTQMVFIGDSLNDYRIARDFGVPFVGVTWTFGQERFKALDKDIPCFSDFVSVNNWIFSHAELVMDVQLS
ncbi:HAD hydrolase-like protein [Desulfobacterota bacterium AH_259_B03_O07]|nr:HAD hydrolase-like protein [Desulfobacterota bacterium AH_259_B03_O07]